MPIVFALVGDVVWTAIDAKPKVTRRLQRLRNLEAHPEVSLLVDRYDDDWSRLWWVRVDGTASVVSVSEPAAAKNALSALAEKYAQYRTDPPAGPFVRIEGLTWRAWHA